MKEKKIFYGWFIVIGCVLITATMVPLIMSQSSKFLIQVTEEMNISRSAFTLANTILQALGIFLSPVAARMLVKGNFKRVHAISVFLFAAAYASYALAPNVYCLYISAFFVGIFYLNATLIPVSMVITNWFTKKRGLAMSIAMAGIGAGGFILSPVITALLDAFGWRMTYVAMALIVLVIALPTSVFILKFKPEDMGLKALGEGEEPHTKGEAQQEKAGVTLSVGQSKFKLFFVLLMVAMLTNAIINSGSLGQFPPALEGMHGAGVAAGIISLYSLFSIIGKLIFGWVNDKFGVVVSSVYGCLAFVLCFIFMLMGENQVMLYAMAVCFGLGSAIGTVSPSLLVADIFGTKKYPEAYGIANSFTQIGLSVGSIFVASMFDMTGSYQTAWYILIGLTVFTAFGWVIALTSARKYKPETN